jgi:hypothetical protein
MLIVSPRRLSPLRILGWLAVLALVALATLGPTARPALAGDGPCELVIIKLGPAAPCPESLAFITIFKELDADLDLATTTDRTSGGAGWTFSYDVTGGSVDAEGTDETTDATGTTQLTVAVEGASAEVTITELAVVSSSLLGVTCHETSLVDSEVILGPSFGSAEGMGITIDVEADGHYACYFTNSAPEVEETGAIIGILKLVDADGDLETDDDQEPAADWEYSLGGDPVSVVVEQPVTDEHGTGGFIFGFSGDSVDVQVTEDLPLGWAVLDAGCEALDLGEIAEVSGPILEIEGLRRMALPGPPGETTTVPTTLEGATLGLTAEAETAYFCVFINAESTPGASPSGGVGPSVTLPPTDAGSRFSVATTEAWPGVLLALGALSAGVLLLLPAPRRRRR